LISVALVLFAVSFVWPMVDRGSLSYSDEDARQYQQASIELHSRICTHGHSGHEDGQHAHASDLDKAREAFNKVKAHRDAALNRGRRIGWIIRAMAILCSAAGIIVYVKESKQGHHPA
jgi:hypothetical protein